jgi:glycosyltransferase involved in cell wall biosynthesis
VLHVPYTFFPDASGGAEVYVQSLAMRLGGLGWASEIAAPAAVSSHYVHEGLGVHRFAIDPAPRRDYAYGAPDPVAAEGFSEILDRLKPEVVHLHARTAAVSDALAGAAKASGAKVVFTFHTPTVSCARGTMMHLGQRACDGRLDGRRCTACLLEKHGAPPAIRTVLGGLPESLGNALAGLDPSGRAATALRMKGLIGAAHRRFGRLMDLADRVVAPCDWAMAVLQRNGVAPPKLVLCRQGVAEAGRPPLGPAEAGRTDDRLRVGWFGRLDPDKGADLLVSALALAPEARLSLDLFGVRQPGSEAYADRLAAAVATDERITLHPALQPAAAREAMQRCDVVAVPSRALETGPLVVLEAFAAGAPVIGSRTGGVAELVRDGAEGLLLPVDDPAAWARALADLARSPEALDRLRAGVRPPRTMDDVARDMATLYEGLDDA